MAYSIKPDPIKFCGQCGAQLTRKRYNGRREDRARFLSRRYCDQTCASLGRLKTDPTEAAIRKRYLRFRGHICEKCGTTEHLGLHHIDLNPANNELSNLMTLCDSCHTKWHWDHGKEPSSQRLACSICGKPSKAFGLCLKHYQRYKKHGDPLLTMKKNGSQYTLVKEDRP